MVDLSALWAGPLCARVLADPGADVVKVEDLRRPDGARRGPAAFYDHLHRGTRSVALDLGAEEGRRALRRLIEAADVVIEASRPRALGRWDIRASEHAAGGTIWLSITAYGRAGAAADLAGFGDDVAAGAGLLGREENGPIFCADAIADPLTGLVAALAALRALQTAVGAVLDVAMDRVAGVAARAEPDAGRETDVVGSDATGWLVDDGVRHLPVLPPVLEQSKVHAPELGRHTADVLGRRL